MAGVRNSFWIQCYKKHTKLKICSWKSWSRSLNSKVDICYWKPAVAVIKLYSSVGFLRWVSRMELFCISGRSHSHFFGLGVLLLYSPSCLVNVHTFLRKNCAFFCSSGFLVWACGGGGWVFLPKFPNSSQTFGNSFQTFWNSFQTFWDSRKGFYSYRNGFWAISLAPSRKRNWAGKVRRSWQNNR